MSRKIGPVVVILLYVILPNVVGWKYCINTKNTLYILKKLIRCSACKNVTNKTTVLLWSCLSDPVCLCFKKYILVISMKACRPLGCL